MVVVPFECEGRPGGIHGVVPFGCEGRPGETFPPESIAAPFITGSLGGYSTEFLTPEQQERFTFVKTKLCGNKKIDVANLRKNGMSSVVELINQM
ncbi:hypothetical protein Taro_004724 [Colocasia esculenta]|uniref:Uncharacterized protein n=1 Tax=Colocasia esculenta TaxID=4460 RepID=A0A843TIW7_COLES|nr:hypothetical protein [Colocasia esculenta]